MQTLVVTVLSSLGLLNFLAANSSNLSRCQYESRWVWSHFRDLCWEDEPPAGPDPRCPRRIPTAGMWGAVGAVGLVWATDWRLILDWVPYINGKFKKDS